jgi:hypothetical protein
VSRSRSDLGFRRWAAGLFDQQMWCFGRDIARAGGNILSDLGMCQYRSGEPNRGSTLYTAAVEPGGSVFLWGFGAMYAEPGRGGVFVRRYDFAPRLTARETALGVHEPERLGGLVHPTTGREVTTLRTLLPRLVGWFARYEHWVAETFGAAYREQCLAGRDKPCLVPAGRMAHEWEQVAKKSGRRPADNDRRGPWGELLARLRLREVRSHANRPNEWRIAGRYE